MSYQNISFTLPAADKTAIQQAVQAIKSKLPFLVNLNPSERMRFRKMGAVRTAYVQDVYSAAANNTGAIPAGFSLTEYSKDAALLKDLDDIHTWLSPLFEAVDDTHLALGAEMMKQSDECYGYLKVAAKKSNNQSLTQIVKKIADQLKQKPKGSSSQPGGTGV